MNRRWTRLAILMLACVGAWAQNQNVDYSRVLKWRSIGPYRGGRVTAVAGVVSQPQVYYMGGTGGGVWRTDDAGITWRPISDHYFKTGSVGAIAVAASDPNIIYVGMGEACLRANLSHGDGVYKSTDGGKTWTNIGLRDTQQIGKVRVDPRDPNIVYVAAVGHPYGPNPERGVFRSKDGGQSWQKILFLNDKTGAVDISLDPKNPQVIYASTWQILRQPWGIDSTGPGSGIYKSSDGGDHWKQLTKGLPAGDKGKIGISVSPADPNRVYATVEAEPGGGVYKSDDGGETWQLMNDSFGVRGRQYYYGHIYADPKDRDTVYTFSSKWFLKSTDAGKSYSTLQAPHGDYHDLWIDPNDPQRMVNGNDGGATVTFNGGKTWSTLDNQPTAQFYTVITDSAFPYRIYGAQQDNTTVSIPSRSDGPGIAVADWYSIGGGESGYIAPDPKDPQITYAGSYFGMLTRYDRRNREIRNISPWPDYPGGRTAAQMKYRFQWTYPIVAPASDPGSVYAGANVVFKSTNQGQSWTVISPDLTRDDKQHEQGGRLEEFYSTVFTIAVSPQDKNIIWTGSDDGMVHITRDGGAHWTNVTPSAVQPYTRMNIIEASPHDPGTAYIAANRYQVDDFRPYVYKTSDYGKSWTLLTNGIPQDTFVRVVREDPANSNLLFAGTETGVYVSSNAGENWQSLQLNLPVVPITDLAIKDHDVIAATQGRSFWVLDDISALEQHRRGTNALVSVYAPRPAYRLSATPSFRPVANMGQNPPTGVTVYYALSRQPNSGVTVEFQDATGKTIKAFHSVRNAENAAATGESGGRVAVNERSRPGGPPENAPTAHAGLNRFQWDMRYPDAHGLDGGTFLAGGSLRGPLAVPGRYRVKVTADTESAEQAFEILKDPRVATTEQQFHRQFELLIAIRDKLSQIHEAVNRAQSVRKRVATVAHDRAQLSPAGKQLEVRLDSVMSQLVESRYRGFDDQMLVFPLGLNNRIAALQGYVQGQAGPTDQELVVFQQLSSEADAAIAQLQRMVAEALPRSEQKTPGN